MSLEKSTSQVENYLKITLYGGEGELRWGDGVLLVATITIPGHATFSYVS